MVEQFSQIKEIELERVAAIKHNYGHIGCALSHMKCIDEHPTNDFIAIMEDDCVIKSVDTFYEDIMAIMKYLQKWPEIWEVFNGNPSNITTNAQCHLLNEHPKMISYKPNIGGGSANFIIYNMGNENTRKKLSTFKMRLMKYENLLAQGIISVNKKYKGAPIIDKYLSEKMVCVTRLPLLTYQMASKSDTENRYMNTKQSMDTSEDILNAFLKANC